MAAVMPVRQRAGYLSALSKTYSAIRRLMETGGSTEEALDLQTKLQERYEKYLKCHEAALVAVPEREVSLNASHIDVDQRHLEADEQLQAYINDGRKSEQSLHVGSLFSSRSSIKATSKRSSRQTGRSVASQTNSDRLSEARVQAKLAQVEVEQSKALHEVQKRKLEFDRETARRQIELDYQISMQQKIAEMEKLQAEVTIRESEEMRSILGSDYESDEEREDVTKSETVPKATIGSQTIEEQQSSMIEILNTIYEPKTSDYVKPRDAVVSWLDKSNAKESQPIRVPFNTPTNPRGGYVPPFDVRRDALKTQSNDEKPIQVKTFQVPTQQTLQSVEDIGLMQGRSDAALLSRVLHENRLPKPKMMTFDGDPKRYKLFITSFKNNVEARLEGDDQLKLTLLLDQCTGDAFDLIEDCVMLKSDQGYRTAIEKLERRFGKGHLIAKSYIDGVKEGGSIKPYDVEALVKLADDMQKCQNVLTELEFASDLDSTGTIESIIDRLPESLQNQWIRKSSKIFNIGREPTFQDLTLFVEKQADNCNSKYGRYVAEKRNSTTSKRKPPDKFSEDSKHDETKNLEKNSRYAVTTLATETESTAGHHSNKPRCLHCDRVGHIIWKCFKFKKLSIDERLAVVQRLDLCSCCLKQGHQDTNCDRTCVTCGGNHHSLLHLDEARV